MISSQGRTTAEHRLFVKAPALLCKRTSGFRHMYNVVPTLTSQKLLYLLRIYIRRKLSYKVGFVRSK